jgi:hypothetical protein
VKLCHSLEEWNLERNLSASESARSVSATVIPGIHISAWDGPDFSQAGVCRRKSLRDVKGGQHIPLLEMPLGNRHAPMARQHSTCQLTLSTWVLDRPKIGGIEIFVPRS